MMSSKRNSPKRTEDVGRLEFDGKNSLTHQIDYSSTRVFLESNENGCNQFHISFMPLHKICSESGQERGEESTVGEDKRVEERGIGN